MAPRKKNIRGTGLTQLRSTVTTSDGTSITEVETWAGNYKDLQTKQKSVYRAAKGTALAPSSAGEGILTVTREEQLSGDSTFETNEKNIEVIWEELRRPVETNPAFKDLSVEEIAQVKKAADDRSGVPTEGEMIAKLYELLIRGTTEYSLGVPKVRRTTQNVKGGLGGGKAWYRDNPPVSVEGSWEFLKTADERRLEGKKYVQVEEWTGAEKWDETLYPSAGGGA